MKTKYILGICSAAALALAPTAHAVTSENIQYSLDGGAFVQLTAQDDNVSGDLNPASGAIIHTFNLGNGVSIIVQANGNASGTGSPVLDLGIGGFLGAGHTVTIEFSANGFTPPSAGAYQTSVGVVGQGDYSVTETTRIGNANTLFAPAGGTMPTIGPINIGQSGSSSGAAPGTTPSPYSITISETITGGRTDSTLSVDTTIKVPDGGNTLMLLGSALSVLGGYGMFRKKA